MKLQPVVRIKIFVVLASILFALTVWIVNSNKGAVIVEASNGAAIYAQSCARCHGADGRGQTAKGKQTGATDLTKWSGSESRAIRAITNGKGKMPAFKKTLSAEQIQAVAAHALAF